MKTPTCEIYYDAQKGRWSLWGNSGGQLEYVSQRIETKQRPTGEAYQVMVLRFTDHDAWSMPVEGLIDGKYYEVEIPLADGI